MRYLFVVSGDEERADFQRWTGEQVFGLLRPVFCSGYKQLDWSAWGSGSMADAVQVKELAACERLWHHILESGPVYTLNGENRQVAYHPENLLVTLGDVCAVEQAGAAGRLRG